MYRIVTFPIVLYGFETWSLTLREERRVRVLRRAFEHRKDEVTGEWGKLLNEVLNDLYCSLSIVQVIKWRMRWAGYVERMGKGEVYTGIWW